MDDAEESCQPLNGGIPVMTQKIEQQGTDSSILDQFFFFSHNYADTPFKCRIQYRGKWEKMQAAKTEKQYHCMG